jgi:pyridoxal biosynthesis lyase PdxS
MSIYYVIALLRYTPKEVREVGGVARPPACMARSLVKHVKINVVHKRAAHPSERRTLSTTARAPRHSATPQ